MANRERIDATHYVNSGYFSPTLAIPLSLRDRLFRRNVYLAQINVTLLTMKKIGLTGGIASGKSQVARIISQNGIPVIDLDVVGNHILERDVGIHKALAKWGDVFTNGKPDRQKLRRLVFSQPEKRKQLEALLHPKIRNRFEADAKDAAAKGHKVIVCEAPLLIEGGYYKSMDELVVVISDRETRISRVMDRDQVSEKLAEQIIDAQTNDDERRKHATHIIENNGTLAELAEKVSVLIEHWKR